MEAGEGKMKTNKYDRTLIKRLQEVSMGQGMCLPFINAPFVVFSNEK